MTRFQKKRINHNIEILDYGEIGMGGPHSLEIFINKIKINGLFFDFHCISADNQFFSITKYIQNKQEVFQQIYIFNLNIKVYTKLNMVNGLVKPIRFEQNKLIFIKELAREKGIQREFEIDLGQINNWKIISIPKTLDLP